MSGKPSSLSVVANTRRNLSPSSIGYTQLFMSKMRSILNDSDSQCNLKERYMLLHQVYVIISHSYLELKNHSNILSVKDMYFNNEHYTLKLGQIFSLLDQCLLHQKYLQTRRLPFQCSATVSSPSPNNQYLTLLSCGLSVKIKTFDSRLKSFRLFEI